MSKRKHPVKSKEPGLSEQDLRQLKTFTALSNSMTLKQRPQDNPFVSDRVRSVPGKQRVGQVTVDEEALGLLFDGLGSDPSNLTRMTMDDLL